MRQVQDDKAANQAWRKKPRKFAPKSRLGCKTCKIRRVKCDLSRPSCLKCKSTGRACDGYDESPPACGNDNHRAGSHDSDQSSTTVGAYRPKQRQWHAQTRHGLSLHHPGPFLVLPTTGSAQTEAMGFFECISIRDLNKYQPRDEPWRNTLMFFAQTVPSVRHAATALALLQRNYLGGSLSSTELVQLSNDWRLIDREAPLYHYTKAIQLLLSQDFDGWNNIEKQAITLLVCYLFTCFDHLAGQDVQAMNHLRGGVQLSRNLDHSMLENSGGNVINSSEVHTLVSQITGQIRRLDMQAVMFLLDWTPVEAQDIATTDPFAACDSAFRSLDEAAEHIQKLIVRVMTLRNTEEEMYPTGKLPPPPSPSSPKDLILIQLETWSILFENMLEQQKQHSDCYETDPKTNGPFISLLRLQYRIGWIFLSSYGPDREMAYDAFLPQFQECVAMANEVVAAHEQHSGSSQLPTFTPEVGILPMLYIIGAKCRHGPVRREVLRILRRRPIREAVWDSIWTATVLERVMEIEEGGKSEARNMGQIAVWQRVEALSWIHIPTGPCAPRLDMTCTFCTREGVHTESLML